MSVESDLKKEINRLKNLKNNDSLSEEAIERIANINIKVRDFRKNPLFKYIKKPNKEVISEDKERAENEQKLAEERYKSYLETHDIESLSDLDTLRSLVYLEVYQDRIQKIINSQDYASDKLTKQLVDIQNQKRDLKIRLEIDRPENKVDDLTALQRLQKKMNTYIQFNRNEFTTCCAECGTILLLRRKCNKENFQNLKHPMFSGRFYYNSRAIQLVKEGKLTKEQYSWVFHTSPQYVDWCIEHEGDAIEIDKISSSDIEQFIKEKWYLKDGFQESQVRTDE